MTQRSGIHPPYLDNFTDLFVLRLRPPNNASQAASSCIIQVAIALRSRLAIFENLPTNFAFALASGANLAFVNSVRALAQRKRTPIAQSHTMLLPSAFLCEGQPQSPHTAHHPRAQSITSPPASLRHRRTSSTISSDIYTSCRTLQARLSTNLAPSPLRALRTPTLLPSPAFSTDAKPLRSKERKPSPAQNRPQTPPRGGRKRRRSVSDDEGRDSDEQKRCDAPSTPKRQCRAPPSLPLGLSLVDFDDLERLPKSPPTPSDGAAIIPLSKPIRRNVHPTHGVETFHPTTYPSSLVSLILKKLSLNEKGRNRLEIRTEDIDDRWRSVLAEDETARGLKVRREMVIRRGRRQRTSLGALDGVWLADKD